MSVLQIEAQTTIFKHMRAIVAEISSELGVSIDFHADSELVTYPSVSVIPITEEGIDGGLHANYDKYMFNIYVPANNGFLSRQIRRKIMEKLNISTNNAMYSTYIPLLDYSTPTPRAVGRGRLDLDSREGFERKPTGESSERRYGAVFKFFYDL